MRKCVQNGEALVAGDARTLPALLGGRKDPEDEYAAVFE